MSGRGLAVVLALGCVVPALTAEGAGAASSVTANPISAIEGQAFGGAVGSDNGCGTGDSATVDWGDGTAQGERGRL